MSETKKSKPKKAARRNRAAEIANTLEWLITAFILAFVFRAFIMEAFRIPTGSMADTLKGAHFRLCCGQCGYKYDHGFIPQEYNRPQDTVPRVNVEPPHTRCPSCGHYPRTARTMPVANGDKILVLKCIYQFFEPKQWDVVVFKNPLDPQINYIKRLVGRPGEAVEIIDGDVYINGQISRKPPKVQNELWMPVYDNDYQPIRPEEPFFNGRKWRQPFDIANSKWTFDKGNPTILRLDSPANQTDTLTYDTLVGNDFRVTYAYDDVREYRHMPYCSDLMVRFYLNPAELQGSIGIALSKYQNHYRAWVDLAGEMVITKTDKYGKTIELDRKAIKSPAANKPTLVRFANVDHQLIFEFGSEKLTYDLGRGPKDVGERKTNVQPQAKIFGAGKLTLSHIAVFRDIHYTAAKFADGRESGRAVEGNPFTLKDDQFFVLGDNSPNSEDGRWWNKPGIGNNGRTYREGVVPRDYLVGKALLVYWPSGFKFPWPQSLRTFLLKNSQHNRLFQIMYVIVSLRWVPNIGQMRLIYGGSSKNL